MPNKRAEKLLYVFLAIAFWLIVWEAASFFINDNLKLFLPSPVLVLKALISLIKTASFWKAVLLTLLRIFTGFLCGVLTGILFGILTSGLKIFNAVFSPAMRIIRAVPVVAFIILAYLFINVNYLPIFICFLMVMPLMWQTVHDELSGFDTNLAEMATVFNIKGLKKLFLIEFVTISDEIITTMVNGIGLAWKSGIASEVLCTPAISLGKNIYRAKGNINYDEVYAITLTVVILSILIELFIKSTCKKKLRTENKDD